MSPRNCSPSMTSACMCFIACIAAAMTRSSPPTNRCICMSIPPPPRRRRSIPPCAQAGGDSQRSGGVAKAARSGALDRPAALSAIAMPKVVDHAQRRDEIALVACQVVAKYGFEQATVARIARAAGYTTGMVAHYFESKQEIILAALRLMLLRIEQRLTRERHSGEANLLEVLSEALALDEQRFTECAFWMAFWGQVSADKKLRRLNIWVHREYQRLVCALLCGTLARMGRLAAVVARSGPAFGGDLHQRPDREFRDQSARLAGGRADRATALAIGSAAALGNAEAQEPNRLNWESPWISLSVKNSNW